MGVVKLREILEYLDEKVLLQEHQEYITIKVKRRFGGLEKRETLLGKEIKTKNQFKLHSNCFIISRVQCWHQAYAITPKDLPNNMIASQNYDQFRIGEVADERYFWWLTNSEFFTNLVRSCAHGVVKEKMVFKREVFLEQEIFLPSIEEQIKIGKFLDDIHHDQQLLSEQIAQSRTNLDKLKDSIVREAVQGKLTEQWRLKYPNLESASDLLARIKQEKQKLIENKLVRKEKPLPPIESTEEPYSLDDSWEWCRFQDITKSIEAGKSPKCNPDPAGINDWGVIKMSAISWGEFNADENKSLPADTEPFSDKEILPGDFILTRANTRQLIARSVVVPDDARSKLLLNDKTLRFAFFSDINVDYVNLFNNSLTAREHYEEVSTGTSDSMKNISRDNIKALKFALPPMQEQSAIVDRVHSVMNLCKDLEQELMAALQKTDTLMRSCLKEVFSSKED